MSGPHRSSREVLQARAALLQDIRQFFSEREVLEVETPLLRPCTVTDLHIESLAVSPAKNPEQRLGYLQTSPEYAMKQMLCIGDNTGAIYQICKAFRDDEPSRLHRPEFTLLEWYRPGFSLDQLMDEVEALVGRVSDCSAIERISYGELFRDHLDIDPHTVSLDEIETLATSRMEISATGLEVSDYLQLLLAQEIEPNLPGALFVYDFPVAQAALARVETDSSGQQVARRFELFCSGMELANGYQELTDADEQRNRFERDRQRRLQAGKPQYTIDTELLSALADGMPECAGVALGLDRLLMLKMGATHIDEVMDPGQGRG